MRYFKEIVAAAVIAFSMPSCAKYCDARGVYQGNELIGMRVKGQECCYEFLRDGEKVIVEKLLEKGDQVERTLVGRCDFKDVSEVFENVDEERNPKVNLDALLAGLETIK